jgi:DNA-binding NarL/FixJ family response regulator
MAHDPLWCAESRKAEIAEELTLSPKTVSNHVSNIFAKLQVVDRAQTALRAQQAGIE